MSLLPQLSGRINKERTDQFMCHFPHSHRSSHFTSFARGTWNGFIDISMVKEKEKEQKPLPKYELYNLRKDPYETKNLALGNTGKTNEMIRLMSRQLETEDALFPVRGDAELRPQPIK